MHAQLNVGTALVVLWLIQAIPGALAASTPVLLHAYGGPCCLGGLGKFGQPRGVAFTSDGSVIVTDLTNHLVQRLKPDGSFVAITTTSGTPMDVAVDSHDNIYIADANNNSISKYLLSGARVLTWGGVSGSGPGQFNFPYGLAVDNQDNVYVADVNNGRVQEFSSAGVFIRAIPIHVDGDQINSGPQSIAIDDVGRMYVADGNNGSVKVFDAGGNVLSVWPGFQRAFGIAINIDGDVLVADTNTDHMRLLSPEGQLLLSWSDAGATGQEFDPFGVATDRSGRIAIADWLSHRLLIYGYGPTPILRRSWGDLKASYR